MLGYKTKLRNVSILFNFYNENNNENEGPKMYHRDSDSLHDQVKVFMLANNISDKYKSINKILDEILNFSIKSKKRTKIELINRLMTLIFQGGSTTDATPYVNIDFFDKNFVNHFVNESFYKVKNYKGLNKLQKSQILDVEYIKLPRNLKFTDRLSMSNSIETRLPLLDIDLAKYCFNLNNDFKIHLGENRWIMKKVLKKCKKI